MNVKDGCGCHLLDDNRQKSCVRIGRCFNGGEGSGALAEEGEDGSLGVAVSRIRGADLSSGGGW